jgi:phage terminase small subunit
MKTPPKEKQLTPKQAAFCAEYMIDLNATKAAIRAGYSEKTAASIGQENLRKPEIQREISELMAERAKRVEVSADTVLSELLKIATVDIGLAFKEDGSLKEIHDMPVEIRRAISGVDVFEEFEGRGEDREQVGWTKKVRFWDKTKALEMLGRHLRLFIDKVEHSGPGGGPIQTEGDFRPTPEDEAVIRRIADARAKLKEGKASDE